MSRMREAKRTNEELVVLALQGNSEVKDQLASQNLKLASYTAHKFMNTGVGFDELYGLCLVGLTKAINGFKPEAGFKFATYASRCMSNEILQYLRKNKKRLKTVSLDAPIIDDEPICLLDTIADSSLDQEYDLDEVYEIVNKVIEKENAQNQKIITSFIFEGKSQKVIGKEVGLTQSYVSRLIRVFMKKVQNAAYVDGLSQIEPPQIERKERLEELAKAQKPVPPELTKAVFESLKAKGMSIRSIAKEFNRSPSWVHSQVKKWEGTPPKEAKVDKDTSQKDLEIENQQLQSELSAAHETIQELIRKLELMENLLTNKTHSLEDQLKSVKEERNVLLKTIEIIYNQKVS